MTSLPFTRYTTPHVFVNFSGGKDSLAALLVTLKHFERAQVTAVFNDTGAELPSTYEYMRQFNALVFPVKRLAHRIVGTKETARGIENILELIELDWSEPVGARSALTFGAQTRQRYERKPDSPGWPSPSNRFCTRALKQQVTHKYVRQVIPDLSARARCVLVMGLRREESRTRAKTPDWGFDPELGIMNWFPVVAWTRSQVLDYIRFWGIPLNPVYEVVSRANCGMCFFSTHREIIDAEKAWPGYLDPYIQIEAEIGRSWKPGMSLKTLQAIAAGRIPDQLPMFEPVTSEGLSCMSGFCEF